MNVLCAFEYVCPKLYKLIDLQNITEDNVHYFRVTVLFGKSKLLSGSQIRLQSYNQPVKSRAQNWTRMDEHIDDV